MPLCVHASIRSESTAFGLVAVQFNVKLSYGSVSGHDVSRPRNDSGKVVKLLIIKSK